MSVYTLSDLEQAEAYLEIQNKRYENYTGNNPNKYRTAINDAAAKVRLIKSMLKANGVIHMSDAEKLDRSLDQLFPRAKSNEIVEYEGNRYRLQFYPLSKSLSGRTVTEWGRTWVHLAE